MPLLNSYQIDPNFSIPTTTAATSLLASPNSSHGFFQFLRQQQRNGLSSSLHSFSSFLLTFKPYPTEAIASPHISLLPNRTRQQLLCFLTSPSVDDDNSYNIKVMECFSQSDEPRDEAKSNFMGMSPPSDEPRDEAELIPKPEIGAESVENFEAVMRGLDELTSQLSLNNSSNRNNQFAGASSTIMTEDCQKFSTPLKVRTKGRPPSKRKVSTLEQKLNRKKSAQTSKKYQSMSQNQFGTQESQFVTQESMLNDDEDDEDRLEEEDNDEHEETLCGACGQNYTTDEFWICCDICEKWFHGKCVKITPARAEHMKRYKCPSCSNNKARPCF